MLNIFVTNALQPCDQTGGQESSHSSLSHCPPTHWGQHQGNVKNSSAFCIFDHSRYLIYVQYKVEYWSLILDGCQRRVGRRVVTRVVLPMEVM